MSYSFPILTWTVFSPLIGLIVLMFLNKERHDAIRWTSAFFAFVTMQRRWQLA